MRFCAWLATGKRTFLAYSGATGWTIHGDCLFGFGFFLHGVKPSTASQNRRYASAQLAMSKNHRDATGKTQAPIESGTLRYHSEVWPLLLIAAVTNLPSNLRSVTDRL